MGRELAYTQVFPTVEDAKEASEVVEGYKALEESILTGDPSVLLGTLHQKDEVALKKFAKNFLPTIQKGNPQLFARIITPYIKNVFIAAQEDAEAAGNEQLKNSIGWIAKYLWPKFEGDIPPEPKDEEEKVDTTKPDPKQEALANENRTLKQQQMAQFAENTKDTTEKILKNDILSKVDPNNALTEFVQDALVSKIMQELRETLNKDIEHRKSMTKLWTKAAQSGYTKEDRRQLISAFLARARKILPTIRNKYAKEVNAKIASRPTERVNSVRRRIPESGNPSGRSSGQPNSKHVDYSRTSDEDILNDRITLRK
jgi:hypothetical protein